MKLLCYALTPDPPELVPASATRAWMDEFASRHPYRCLPMTIGNTWGWEILSPAKFAISWNGGPTNDDLTFEVLDDFPWLSHFAQSNFSRGIATFHTGYLFRTEPGWDLMTSGPINSPKDGIDALAGVIETDWLPYPFTMNWHFTRPGTVVFEKGEPFCLVYPVPHGALEEVEPIIQDLADNAQLLAQYNAWRERREEFMERFRAGDKSTLKEAWQKFYFVGKRPSQEEPVEGHISKLKLKKPLDKRKKAVV